MTKKTLVFVILLAIVVSASVVSAVGPRGRGRSLPPPPAGTCAIPGPVLRELGLTGDQLAQIRELCGRCCEATKTTREQIQAKAKELAELWSVDEPNAAAIKSLAAEIDSLRAEIRDTCIDYALRVLRVLTPEQRAKLRDIIRNRPGFGWGCCTGFGMCGCFGPGCGMGFGRGGGMGMGMGPGMGNATGPRAQIGTCPHKK